MTSLSVVHALDRWDVCEKFVAYRNAVKVKICYRYFSNARTVRYLHATLTRSPYTRNRFAKLTVVAVTSLLSAKRLSPYALCAKEVTKR